MMDWWALGASLTALLLAVLGRMAAPTRGWALALTLTALVLNGWSCWRVGRVWWARRSSRQSLRHLVRSQAPAVMWDRPMRRVPRGEAEGVGRRELREVLRALADGPTGPGGALREAVRYRVETRRPGTGTSWTFLQGQER